MKPTDWSTVRDIYRQGIESGNATFELETPDWERWHNGHLTSPRLIARDDFHILGWAALSPISSRSVYRGVAEVSVYVAAEARGSGVGTALLKYLIAASEHAGIWTLQAGIFPENQVSIGIHLRCGFRKVGRRERMGELQGVWRDVVLLERRSKRVFYD